MEEYCYYYDITNDKHYQVIEFPIADSDGKANIKGLKIKECRLVLFDTIIVAKDPENSKEYERVEVYEKIAIGRAKVFPNCMYKRMTTTHGINACRDLILYDKYWYKTIE